MDYFPIFIETRSEHHTTFKYCLLSQQREDPSA